MNYGYVPPPVPPPLPVPQATWFSRNWKWFIPTVILVPILLIVFLGSIAVFAVFAMIKSSDPYHHALEVASQDPRVVQKLGAPIVPAWYAGGSINQSGSSGYANLLIPVKGQLHSATVFVIARKSEGTWNYQRLGIRIEGETASINLLRMTPPNQSPTPEEPAEDEDK